MNDKNYDEYLFRINYYFEGHRWIKPLKWYALECFMKLRKKYAMAFNANIDLINDEWHRLNPDVGYLEEDSDDWNRYNRFVFAMMKPHIDKLCRRNNNMLFEPGMNPETCDFRLQCKLNKNMYVDYDMTPVKKL